MRDYRIRTENADRLIQELINSGFEANYSKCRPKTTWNNGCSNPNCCPQHPDAIIEEICNRKFARMPDTWCAITTTAPSNTVHRILQEIFNNEDE